MLQALDQLYRTDVEVICITRGGGDVTEFLQGLYYALLEGRFFFDFVHEDDLVMESGHRGTDLLGEGCDVVLFVERQLGVGERGRRPGSTARSAPGFSRIFTNPGPAAPASATSVSVAIGAVSSPGGSAPVAARSASG